MMKALALLLVAVGLCSAGMGPVPESVQVMQQIAEADPDEAEMVEMEALAMQEDLMGKTQPKHFNDHSWMTYGGYGDDSQTTIGGMKPRDFFNINDWDEIQERATDAEAAKFVRQKKQVYYSIDPAKSMRQMGEVGSLLRLSYAGTKGFKSSSLVLRLLSGYQDLVKHSLVTASTFVEIALRALRYHKVSFIMIQYDKVEKSLYYLGKTEAMAGRIAEECQTIIDKCDEMVKLATDALIGVNDDHVATVEERKKIIELIKQLKVDEARQKSMKNDIDAMVDEFRAEEKRNEATAEEKTKWGMIMDIFSPLADKVISIGLCKLNQGDEPMLELADKSATSNDDILPPLPPTDGDVVDPGVLPPLPPTDGDGDNGGIEPPFPPDNGGGTDGIEPPFPPDNGGGTDGIGPFPPDNGGGPDGNGGTGGTGGFLEGCATADNGQILPRGDKMHQLAQLAREREKQAREARIEWQKKQLDANAELAATVQKLANSKDSKDQLDKTIFGLDIAIKSLGKVKTIFLNAQVFWIGVQKHAKSLQIDQEEIKDYAEIPEMREEYDKAVINSGLSWVAIASILRDAALQIRKVDEGVDEVMSDLPTESEARTLIEQLRREITEDIREDNENIKKELKSDHNKLPLPNKVKLPIVDDKLTVSEIKSMVAKIRQGTPAKKQ